MPPKENKKGGKGQIDPAMAEKMEELDWIKRVCEAREWKLHVASEQLQRSKLESLNLKKKIADLNEKFEAESKMTDRTCSDMFKMYDSGKSQLYARITSHQDSIKELRKQLDEARHNLERTKAEKDEEIAKKTKAINEQKQMMEQMAIRFGVELKETLEHMSHHIHVQGREGQ